MPNASSNVAALDLGWLLQSSGAFSHAAVPTLDLLVEPEAADTLGLNNLLALKGVGLVFKSPHDGRSFSLARQLRNAGFSGQLVGLGRLMPDQARHAFQSGLDALWLEDQLVQRHGADAWQNALNVVVADLYSQQRLPLGLTERLALPDIWQRRQNAAAKTLPPKHCL